MGKIVKPNAGNKAPADNIAPAAMAEGAPKTASRRRSRVEIRQEIGLEIKTAAELLRSLGFPDLSAKINDLAGKAARDRFSVAFVGEFSHGKSSLINNILSAPLLPTDTLPTTSLLTQVSYAAKESIEVLDRRGRIVERKPLEDSVWEGLTAFDADGNPVECGERRMVRVAAANPWLRSAGIDILDTPGANDGSKERDMEISKALMIADGAVVCVDAQKGIMQTQAAFILDRILAPKVPYIAVAVTHLDCVPLENRDRVLGAIIASLKGLNVEMPVIVTNDVKMPSDRYADLVGLDKIRALLKRWSHNPDRAARIETWLATAVQAVLAMSVQALEQKKEILDAKGEERQKLIVEKQKSITLLHGDWERLRGELEERRDACRRDFLRKRDHECANIISAMRYRISTVPDPAKWYQQSYSYEISNRVSASIISLDNYVTETARYDFDWLNKTIAGRYKATIERDNKTWGRTPDSSSYVHEKAPDFANIDRMQDSNIKITAAATAVGGLLGGLLFGIGGIVGSVGASTAVRFLGKKKIAKEIEKARGELYAFVEEDIKNLLADATRDCEGRIALIYGDIARSAKLSESSWMQAQHEAIKQAARPAEDTAGKTAAQIDDRIRQINEISEKLNNIIN